MRGGGTGPFIFSCITSSLLARKRKSRETTLQIKVKGPTSLYLKLPTLEIQDSKGEVGCSGVHVQLFFLIVCWRVCLYRGGTAAMADPFRWQMRTDRSWGQPTNEVG